MHGHYHVFVAFKRNGDMIFRPLKFLGVDAVEIVDGESERVANFRWKEGRKEWIADCGLRHEDADAWPPT